MSKVLTIVAMLACGALLRAQSWEALHELKSGDRIEVVDDAGKQHKGIYAAHSADAISLTSRNSQVSIDRAHVRRVKVRSGTRRVRNLAIGAGIGLALGLTIDNTLGAYFRNETGESAGARALTYIAPIAVFGGIGAAMPGRRTIYKSR